MIETDSERGLRALRCCSFAGVIDQNPPHHLRGDSKEVRAVLPGDPFLAEQPQLRLVDERRRLQGVVRAFMAQIRRCPATEVTIDQRHQRVTRSNVPLRPGSKQGADRVIGHGSHRPLEGLGYTAVPAAGQRRAAAC